VEEEQVREMPKWERSEKGIFSMEKYVFVPYK